jgi:hypothetical protein
MVACMELFPSGVVPCRKKNDCTTGDHRPDGLQPVYTVVGILIPERIPSFWAMYNIRSTTRME